MKIWNRKPAICSACEHTILKGRLDCPECDRIASANPDAFTPCASDTTLPATVRPLISQRLKGDFR